MPLTSDADHNVLTLAPDEPNEAGARTLDQGVDTVGAIPSVTLRPSFIVRWRPLPEPVTVSV